MTPDERIAALEAEVMDLRERLSITSHAASPAELAARATRGLRLAIAYVRACAEEDTRVSTDLAGAVIEDGLFYEFVSGLCALVIGRGNIANLGRFLDHALSRVNEGDVAGTYEKFFREKP